MAEIQRHCDTHQDIVGFKYPFPHLTRSLKLQRKIKIVAIGSSSTAGEGDVVPYPARLELLLRAAFHDSQPGDEQEAPSELSRFEPDVIGEAPAPVIWQVGTNAVFRKEEFNFDDVAGSIATGLGWLASLPTDVVLMDLQYATALVVPDEKKGFAVDMVNRISVAAEKAGVNVFRRFALMQHWNLEDGIAMEDLIRRDDPNHLHMSDWATNCVTQALYEAIINAASVTA
jgi:acyl-CoA thioesterase-1